MAQKTDAEALSFVLAEGRKQHEEFFSTRDSLDSRASIMLGLLGVIASVFIGAFSTYWTSQAPTTLRAASERAFYLAAFLTTASLIAVAVALVLLVSVLRTRRYALGADLVDTYEAVRDGYSAAAIGTVVLKRLAEMLNHNYTLFYRSILRYEFASTLTIAAVLLAMEFVGLQIGSSAAGSSAVEDLSSLLLSLAIAIGVFIAIQSYLIISAHRLSLAEEERIRERLAKMESR